ncbi:hypothetical protein N2152v2_009232 [Parachlorella kessleri]
MAEVRMLAKRVGIRDPKVLAKAGEYVRVATSRLSGSNLGQVYRTTKATLQRLLGIGSQTTARDLCIQHGCARLEQSVKAALAAYKERFVRRLPPSQQQHVDFGRPVFLATAFYLVAKKNKMKVDKEKLLQPLGVTGKEFGEVHASMYDLVFDLVGVEKAKRKAEDVKGHRELLDATGAHDEEDEQCSSSDEEVVEEGMVGQRVNKRQQQQRDFEEWKAKVTRPAPKKQKALSEKALRQATLTFGGAEEQPGQRAKPPAPSEDSKGQEQQALKEKNGK